MNHLSKVLIGFCGMIVIGMIALSYIEDMKSSQSNSKNGFTVTATSNPKPASGTLPPVVR